MARSFARFMSAGPVSRHCGRGRTLFAVAVAALAAAGAGTQAAQPAAAPVDAASAFHAAPGLVFVEIHRGLAGRRAEAVRRTAAELGRRLAAEAAGSGHARIAVLIESGIRDAFAQGLSLSEVADVATMIDPMGEMLPERDRSRLWRELAGRSGAAPSKRPPVLGPPPATRPADEAAKATDA